MNVLMVPFVVKVKSQSTFYKRNVVLQQWLYDITVIYRVIIGMNKTNLACFLGGAALTAGLFLLSNQNRQKEAPQKNIDYESEQYQALKNEQLARIIKYFGEEKFKKLENSSVIVLGVGGVGSHVVNMLVRSGIKRIKIVDFDRVSLSSLNRHSCAVRKDVGSSKVQCLKSYMNSILPHIQIETVESYVTVENAKTILTPKTDYVIDCIDNLDAKVEVVRLCKEQDIKLICSGGAGMKSDPTRLQIRDIADCKYDNLIGRLRRELVKKGIKSGVKVAFSYQQAQKQLLPLQEHQEDNPDSYRVFDNYRLRIVPVMGTMPAIMGMAIASYVICDLAGEPYSPFETDYVKTSALNKLYNQLINDEKKKGVQLKDLQVDMEEVAILVKEVFHWKSVISDRKENVSRLGRWDQSKPASIDNLALFGKEQYERHLKYESLSAAGYSEEIMVRFAEKSVLAKKLYEGGYMMFI